MLPMLLWLQSTAQAGTCESYSQAEFILETDGIEAHESSGLAASRTRPGVFFTHDDSGADPEIFSFSLDGSIAESHSLDGAEVIDWEDMAAAPCPASIQEKNQISDCLFVGDIGDNPETREEILIYVMAEPSEGASLQALETWHLSYPDGARDSEALLVHPGTGQLTLITKSWSGSVEIYTLADPPEDGVTAVLEFQGELDLEDGGAVGSLITGGDWDPDGERLALRTYAYLYVWETDPCLPDGHWDTVPQRLETTWEWQGEAICFDLDGGLLTSSEGSPMPVSQLDCTNWTPGEGPCDPSQDTGEADTGEPAAQDTDPNDPNPHPGYETYSEPGICGRRSTAAVLFFALGLGLWRRRRGPR